MQWRGFRPFVSCVLVARPCVGDLAGQQPTATLAGFEPRRLTDVLLVSGATLSIEAARDTKEAPHEAP